MTTLSIPEQKAKLREAMRARLRSLDSGARSEQSARLCQRILEWETWRQAASVFLFVPLKNEPDIVPLLERALAEGKTACLPRMEAGGQGYVPARITDPKKELTPGRFGIMEPANASGDYAGNQLDLTLVPGLAFDENGSRLGRGGGYYDRLLAIVGGAKCGVCFDEQIVAQIPAEPHDIRLDCILTPTRFHPVGAARF